MDFGKLARKWRERWERSGIFEADPDERPKFFATFPFPYVNGVPHIAHAFSFLRNEFLARYKRMRGFNVLFPQGWHATGGPIVSAALRIREGDEKQKRILISCGVPEEEVEKFSDPSYWVRYFPRRWREDLSSLGGSVDWRREFVTTSLNPAFSKFVEWQYLKLREKGLVKKGTHPVVWCPKERKVVGDHDRPDEYAGIVPEEALLLKFRQGNIVFPCVTFRPETVYGVTNLWVSEKAEYAEVRIGDEVWIVSRSRVEEFLLQKGGGEVVRTFPGSDLVGLTAVNPETGEPVPVLPSEFVDPDFGTGVVMSVPAHAPFDYAAFRKAVPEGEPVQVIEVEGYGRYPAAEICGEVTDRETLERLTKKLYGDEFYKGVMKVGKYAGMRVSEAKEKIASDLLNSGKAERYFVLPERVKCRCGSWTVVNILRDQWFLRYSDPAWKKEVHRCIDRMRFYPPEIEKNLRRAVDWLRDWACAHKHELGTPLPFDPDWVIESLSDSTIYMAYYTVAKYLEHPEKYGIDVGRLKPSFFDYVFLGKGDPAEVSSENSVPEELLKEMRKEFLYWYPLDFRNSGKDLLQNHLVFFLFHHVAIFPESLWPRSISVNGWVKVGGEKMSKSKGNFITLREALDRWGPDPVRVAEAYAGSPGLDDANFDPEFVKTAAKRLVWFFSRFSELYGSGTEERKEIDDWMETRINKRINEVASLYEKTEYREVVDRLLFDASSDLSWYLKRGGRNSDVLRRFFETHVLMLSPIAPHFCEELWESMGKAGFVSLESWPEAGEVDGKAEEKEELVRTVLEDLRELKKLVKGEWKEVRIYTAKSWKYRARDLVRKTEDPVKELMKDPEIRKQGKEVARFVASLLSAPRGGTLSEEEERSYLASASDFISSEAGCPVSVVGGDESGSPKALRAEPAKPGIEVII